MATANVRPKILNLSNFNLTQHHISVLSRGPKFCPTTRGRKSDACGDSYSLGRKLSIREIFFDSEWTDESLIRKPSKKPILTKNKELSDIIATINKVEPIKCDTNNSNIRKEEESALHEIKRLTKTKIEIKKADKTSTIVIMNKDDYQTQLVEKCHLQTESYEQVDDNIDKRVYKSLAQLCSKHHECLTENERRTILTKIGKRVISMFFLRLINARLSLTTFNTSTTHTSRCQCQVTSPVDQSSVDQNL